MFEVYFWPTPNWEKVTTLLEKLSISCLIRPINVARSDWFAPEFLKLTPNNCILALVDIKSKSSGAPVTIIESGGAFMLLAEMTVMFAKYARLLHEQPKALFERVALPLSATNTGPEIRPICRARRGRCSLPRGANQPYVFPSKTGEAYFIGLPNLWSRMAKSWRE